MTLRQHLNLYRRSAILIVVTALILATAFYAWGAQKYTTGYNATLFVTIAVQHSDTLQNATTSYDETQAADNFTETAQGWFKNPAFLKKIDESSHARVEIAARRQEKQNLLITFTASDEQTLQTIGSRIEAALRSEIEFYNQNTNSNFVIALYSLDIQRAADKTALLLAISLIFGLTAGFALAYTKEYVLLSLKA